MKYKEVNAADYVKEILAKGITPDEFYKYAQVMAREGIPGEVIETIMKNGLVETVNSVKVNPETKQADWVIKNPSGEQYIIPFAKFSSRYEIEGQNKNVFSTYNPVKQIIKAVQIHENISFVAPWGSQMKIEKGGWLVVNNEKDIYGIQLAEFLETYKPTNEKKL